MKWPRSISEARQSFHPTKTEGSTRERASVRATSTISAPLVVALVALGTIITFSSIGRSGN